jgi:hypothetical protein
MKIFETLGLKLGPSKALSPSKASSNYFFLFCSEIQVYFQNSRVTGPCYHADFVTLFKLGSMTVDIPAEDVCGAA